MTWLTVVVQWIHIVAGLAWLGGYVFLALGLWPALLRRPAAEGRAVWEGMEPSVRPLMMVSGMLVFLAGLVRGTLLGPVRSFGFLFGSAYGLTFLVAALLTIGLTVYTANAARATAEKVWDGDGFRPGAAAYVRSSYGLSLVWFAAVLVCMVLMRFGL
jgi:uncharacterized membrane protein